MTARVWLRGRGPWLVVLLVLALGFFGSYVRHGLNFRDEGGTEGLVAQRLLAGERPLVDVVLGYNVGWFYPMVGLFRLFGVNFVLLRGYCFALSTITLLLGFLVVTRASRRPWLGFLAGLLCLLVPGMTFKNYMPLLAVMNGSALLHYALAPRERRWPAVAVGGLLLGLTLLIRIDVGLFVSALWAGTLCLRQLERGTRPGPALLEGGGGLALLGALVLAVHLPVYLHARAHGFAGPFLAQYEEWPRSFARQLEQRLHPPAPALPSPAAAPAVPPATPSPATASTARPADGPVPDRHTLARQGWSQWLQAPTAEARALILLLYLPLLSLVLLLLWTAGAGLVAWWRRDQERYPAALGALVLLGSALTIFPQYFFFRPDSPHLSEFSPGFWVAVLGSLGLLARTRRSRAERWLLWTLALLLSAHAGLFLWRLLPDRWAGTIAARRGRVHFFQGENGVRIYANRRESEGLEAMRQLIRTHSRPGEYLIAYPYQPSVNLLSDRPTYERNVYVDNAIAEPDWNERAIRRLQEKRPPIVVLSDWEINGTPESRFSVWAAPTQAWIAAHYDLQATILDMQFYTLRSP